MMKAIKITEATKQLGEVNSIYSGVIPKTFKRGNETVLRYDLREDLQTEDGWREVINPVYNSETQRLGKVIESATGFTREVIDLTAEEIEAMGVITMPRRDFKIALLKSHGITNSHVDDLLTAVESNNMATSLEVEAMRIMWNESAVFKSNTPELFQFANMMDSVAGISLSQADLKAIFENYASI